MDSLAVPVEHSKGSRHENDMKSRFVRSYLLWVGITLALTALAKGPVILTIFFPTACLGGGDPILGGYQPAGLSNEKLLAVAAGIELVIIALICFSPWRWLPCLAAASWGSLCLVLRFFIIDPSVDCGCFGWLAKPSPFTNLAAGLLASAIAAGGWMALWITWRNARRALILKHTGET
jgi:hypothetical protein